MNEKINSPYQKFNDMIGQSDNDQIDDIASSNNNQHNTSIAPDHTQNNEQSTDHLIDISSITTTRHNNTKTKVQNNNTSTSINNNNNNIPISNPIDDGDNTNTLYHTFSTAQLITPEISVHNDHLDEDITYFNNFTPFTNKMLKTTAPGSPNYAEYLAKFPLTIPYTFDKCYPETGPDVPKRYIASATSMKGVYTTSAGLSFSCDFRSRLMLIISTSAIVWLMLSGLTWASKGRQDPTLTLIWTGIYVLILSVFYYPYLLCTNYAFFACCYIRCCHDDTLPYNHPRNQRACCRPSTACFFKGKPIIESIVQKSLLPINKKVAEAIRKDIKSLRSRYSPLNMLGGTTTTSLLLSPRTPILSHDTNNNNNNNNNNTANNNNIRSPSSSTQQQQQQLRRDQDLLRILDSITTLSGAQQAINDIYAYQDAQRRSLKYILRLEIFEEIQDTYLFPPIRRNYHQNDHDNEYNYNNNNDNQEDYDDDNINTPEYITRQTLNEDGNLRNVLHIEDFVIPLEHIDGVNFEHSMDICQFVKALEQNVQLSNAIIALRNVVHIKTKEIIKDNKNKNSNNVHSTDNNSPNNSNSSSNQLSSSPTTTTTITTLNNQIENENNNNQNNNNQNIHYQFNTTQAQERELHTSSNNNNSIYTNARIDLNDVAPFERGMFIDTTMKSMINEIMATLGKIYFPRIINNIINNNQQQQQQTNNNNNLQWRIIDYCWFDEELICDIITSDKNKNNNNKQHEEKNQDDNNNNDDEKNEIIEIEKICNINNNNNNNTLYYPPTYQQQQEHNNNQLLLIKKLPQKINILSYKEEFHNYNINRINVLNIQDTSIMYRELYRGNIFTNIISPLSSLLSSNNNQNRNNKQKNDNKNKNDNDILSLQHQQQSNSNPTTTISTTTNNNNNNNTYYNNNIDNTWRNEYRFYENSKKLFCFDLNILCYILSVIFGCIPFFNYYWRMNTREVVYDNHITIYINHHTVIDKRFDD